MNNLAVVIPVREGSSRIKDKVLLPFANMTLLEWKIKQIQEVLPSEQIYVSTDSNFLKSLARKLGVAIHDRDPYLCDAHKASFSEVITGTVKDIPFEHIAWATVVVPLMSPADFRIAFEKYQHYVVEERTHDSLVAVNLLKEYLWLDEKPLNYSASKDHTISQHLPNIYRVTNGLYMMPKTNILENEYFLGTNPYKFSVSKISGIDIDEMEDYHISQYLFDLYLKNNKAAQTLNV